jgi:hypothetical protein
VAKPPTALTDLLYQTDGTAESIVDALDRSGCLSVPARESPDAAVAEVAGMLAEEKRAASARAAGWSGPSWADVVAERLIASRLLNGRGRELDRS